MRHRARELLAGQRAAALNALRGHLAEIGLIAPQGAHHAYGLKRMAVDGFNENGEIVVPDCVRSALRSLVGQIDAAAFYVRPAVINSQIFSRTGSLSRRCPTCSSLRRNPRPDLPSRVWAGSIRFCLACRPRRWLKTRPITSF